jgi:hypothetical protein
MIDLREMSRVLYDHNWDSPEDWVRELSRLADLPDEDIVKLTRLGSAKQGLPGA